MGTRIAAKMKDADLHFHDLRGTVATKFYVAGLPIRSIAEIIVTVTVHLIYFVRFAQCGESSVHCHGNTGRTSHDCGDNVIALVSSA
ncbi:hypothetical protein M2427_006007 [Bradyrhizobium sp. BR13661]|jgi:hypothetical protein|nr:hypothetical protein [Bradyrhizobium sp. BR13661]